MHDLSNAPTVFDYLRIVWKRRWLVVLTAIVVAAAMIAYLNFATYRFSATTKVVAAQSGTGSLSSQLGGLGGLASIASARLPQSSGEQNFLVFTQDLVSRTAAEGVLRHPDLVHALFDKEWDRTRKMWVEPNGLLKQILTGTKNLLGLKVYAYRPPDATRIQDYLERFVGMAEDSRKPVVALSYANEDPKLAVRLLQTIIDEVDLDVRHRALARARGNIAYLSTQLRTVQLAESRFALASALAEQEKTRMLASSDAPFAGEPVGHIGVSDRPSPRPLLLLAVAIVGGVFLGMLLAVVSAGFARRPLVVRSRLDQPRTPVEIDSASV